MQNIRQSVAAVISGLFFMLLQPAAAERPIVTVTHTTGRIQTAAFHSRILDREKTFCVILPETSQKNHRHGRILFLLHGRGRTDRSLIDDAVCREVLLSAQMTTVLPDGDDGWYIDSPVRCQDRYEAYLQEVIDVATEHWRLNPRRRARGLSGWSMGGYGCMRFAEQHADEFAAVASVIGLLDFPREGLPEGRRYPVPTERFGHSDRLWTDLNPITHAARLRNTSILIVSADRAFDRTMNENFVARLRQLRIPCEWHLLEGAHTFDTVRRALPLVVDFMERTLTPVPR